MRQIFRVALYFAVLFASISTPVQASRRVGLVIGNGNYENAGALVNPANDAADISRVLSGLGFEPPRVCRRLQILRDWSPGESPDIPQVLAGGA